MLNEIETATATIDTEVTASEEVSMVRRERWEEIRRLGGTERVSIAEIARRLNLDRKTVRHCLHAATWQPYQRPARAATLLSAHADYLHARAEQVDYSAQILWQELRQRGYRGSYETVKLFVRPLRARCLAAERALFRFETPPGRQSQIDWGQARVRFRHTSAVRHIFVLTLGFSRRSYYQSCLNEALPQFLDAHERAFEYFGGRRCLMRRATRGNVQRFVRKPCACGPCRRAASISGICSELSRGLRPARPTARNAVRPPLRHA